MIGNDLVDLDQALKESNWRRNGYLSKIFSPEEQKQIGLSERPDMLVWLFWSMKESVYKIHSRGTGTRAFAPAKLPCRAIWNASGSEGTISIDGMMYYLRSEINSSYIHSIASVSKKRLDRITAQIFTYPDNQFDYKKLNPACVSHHGAYLALIF